MLPITEEHYAEIIDNPQAFRKTWLDPHYADNPELFPDGFGAGYEMNGHYCSKRLGIKIRRIALRNGEQYQIHPAFALPMMVGRVADVANALFLRKFGVPYWALAHVFGKNVTYWYRVELAMGRYNIVDTTVKTADIPTHLVADEHHETLNGEKVYIATTVGAECVLGAEVSPTVSGEDLKTAYGVFKEEAMTVDPEYTPETVNTDGWSGTQAAWSALFPMIVLIRCFLHAWLKIRERSKTLDLFFDIGERVWNVFYAPTRTMMGQRIRRLREWATLKLRGVVLEKVLDLCAKSKLWSVWYDHPDGHATSNMLDRLMRSQNKYFDRGQHFHGCWESANLRSRAWAILHNYWPMCPEAVKDNDGAKCHAEQLNKKRYADNWFENLLVATSLARIKKRPLKMRND